MTVAFQGGADGALYRGMDRAALDAAYDNSKAVADSRRILDDWRARSEAVRAAPDARLDLAYGPRPRNRIDYFPAASVAPLFVFIHGGYWQRNSKEIFAFLAEGPAAHGIAVATVGYTLAPEATLTEIVAEIGQALDFLAAEAGALGFDAGRIVVGGWSAGGHLAAIAGRHPTVRGALPISGIFDLEPIALNYLNAALHLTPAEIAELSPIRHVAAVAAPMRLFAGGDELPELRRQTADYAEAAKSAGRTATATFLPGHNHFTILEELARAQGALALALKAMTAA